MLQVSLFPISLFSIFRTLLYPQQLDYRNITVCLVKFKKNQIVYLVIQEEKNVACD